MSVVATDDSPAPMPVLPPKLRRLPIAEAHERVAALLDNPAPTLGPAPEPCVCAAPRWEHTGPSRTGKCERTGCTRYRRDVVDALVEKALVGYQAGFGDDLRAYEQRERSKRVRREPGTLGIGPSDSGNCPKKIEYRERPPEDFRRDPEDKRPARIGGMIHRDWQNVSQVLYPWRLHEYAIPIPGLDSKNTRADRFDPVTGVLDDCKTAGDWQWDHIGEDGPDEEVWEQVYLYGLGLTRMGFRVRTVRLIYVKRCNGHDEVFERPYDEERALTALDRLLGYAAVLDAGGHLPRTRSGPTNDPLCRMCFARSHCWGMVRAAAIGRSPESYTVLGEDVDRDDIPPVLERYDAGRAMESKGKAVKAEARTLLVGVQFGEYGEWTYDEGYRAGGDDVKARVEQLESYFELPDGERPALSDLPTPQAKASRPISIKRKRRAQRDKDAKAKAKAVTPPTPEPAEATVEVASEPTTDEAGAA